MITTDETDQTWPKVEVVSFDPVRIFLKGSMRKVVKTSVQRSISAVWQCLARSTRIPLLCSMV